MTKEVQAGAIHAPVLGAILAIDAHKAVALEEHAAILTSLLAVVGYDRSEAESLASNQLQHRGDGIIECLTPHDVMLRTRSHPDRWITSMHTRGSWYWKEARCE